MYPHFIELHKKDCAILLRIDSIVLVQGSKIYTTSDRGEECVLVDESYDELKDLIRNSGCAIVNVDLEDNSSLRWNELRAIEGKPVWIDSENLPVGASSYWKDRYIIKSFSNDEFMYCNDGFECMKENARTIIGNPTERNENNV